MMAHSRVLWNALCFGVLLLTGGCGSFESSLEEAFGWEQGNVLQSQVPTPEDTAPDPASADALDSADAPSPGSVGVPDLDSADALSSGFIDIPDLDSADTLSSGFIDVPDLDSADTLVPTPADTLIPTPTDAPDLDIALAPIPTDTIVEDLLEESTVPIVPDVAGEVDVDVFGSIEVGVPVREDLESVRVGLLLPMGAKQPGLARIAADMRNAAELALFELGMDEIVLLPLDTKGTAAGARAAMQQAMDSQADIVLGPLLAPEVSASSSLAAEHGVTMIAFSNDFSVLKDHVLLLNFSPEQDVERILSFAHDRGIRDYAALLPDNSYGRRVESILHRHILATSSTLHGIERYARVIDGPYEPARKLGNLPRKSAIVNGEEKQSPPFDAILLADSGQMLRIAASALAYFDVAPPDVQLLGTNRWDDADAFDEPALQHGWYPAARSRSSEWFLRRYEEIYGGAPNHFAGLSYDAVWLVGFLTREGNSWRTENAPPDALLRPGGFAGIQGLFRFLPDGRSERALAIWEIAEGSAILLQAPEDFFSGGG